MIIVLFGVVINMNDDYYVLHDTVHGRSSSGFVSAVCPLENSFFSLQKLYERANYDGTVDCHAKET